MVIAVNGHTVKCGPWQIEMANLNLSWMSLDTQ